MCLESVDIPMIKILRLLRTLRPLRFISHNINLKIVVTALLESVSAIINVLIVLLFYGLTGSNENEDFFFTSSHCCLLSLLN